MLHLDKLTSEQRHVVDVYRDVRNCVGDLCFGDAMTALGMAANSVMQSIPPEKRMAIAGKWAETFIRMVYAAIELGDA